MDANHIYQLGDPETAVISLVNLISTATGANEEKLAFWLDAYYQARLAYEKATAPEPDPTILRRSDLEPVLRQLWDETLHKSCHKEAAKRMEERKPKKSKVDLQTLSVTEYKPITIRAEDLEEADHSALELLGIAPTADEPAVSPAAAAFKVQQRNRLVELRSLGLHIAQIEEASAGALTDHQILSILEGSRQPVAVYRVLCSALDKLEPLFRGRSDT